MSNPDKTLLITADDYGMSARFNRGIVEMVQLGLVRNVSVMVYEPYVDRDELLALSAALGVHLDLPEQATEDDIEAQIQKFHDLLGRAPDYLDGHGHSHVSDANISSFAAVARRHGLPVRSRKDEDRQYLRGRGLKTPDRFVSWHPKRTEKLFTRLRENDCAVTELVTHPGYQDPDCEYPYNGRREDELNFLKSSGFKDALAAYSLASFHALR